MKRYWKILALCLVTVIVLGAFYIQSSLAAETVVIGFEKVSGDESLVDNLVVNADYVVEDIHQSLFISNEETVNLSNQSLFLQLTSFSMEASSQHLVKKYKHFMRGKNVLRNSFYEDESLLVYADIEGKSINASFLNSFLEIDILDKKSEESTSMKFDLPKNESYNWVNIEDIQIVDTKLKIIAGGSRMKGGEDVIVYTIDLQDKKITNEEVIHSIPKVENGWSEFRVFNDYYSSQPEKYLVFKAEAYEHFEDSGNMAEASEPKAIANDVIVYDIEKNMTEKVDVPEELAGSMENSSIENSTVFVPVQTLNGVDVTQYDIGTRKWEKKQTFTFEPSENSEDAPFVKLQNGKIYIINSTKEGHVLSIGDLQTGETLYEGKLKVKNHKTDKKEYQLYVFEINEL